MNAPTTNLPAERRQPAPIEVLKNVVARKADDFKMVLPSHISVDKFQRTIATAALSNPQLMECNRQSLLIAAMKLAQDGLLPDGREAALVPFKTWNRETRENVWQVQSMPMAYGLRKKILQSGEVLSLQVGVVYADEVNKGFIYEIGLEPPVRHRPDLFAEPEQRTDDKIVAAYSIARIKNGDAEPLWSVEVMARHEIDKVRQASQTGAVGKTVKFGKDAGKPIEPKGPWVDWFAEMAKKTVLRRHSKMLPMSGDLIDTFDRDDAEEQRAQGAARLLEAEESKPLALPAGEELDEQSGEIIEQDMARDPATGMTEVDEETARALDAGEAYDEQTGEVIEGEAQEGDTGEQQQQFPKANHTGPKPSNAQHGDSWFDTEEGKIRYAHQVANGGIKWYLKPPEGPAPEPQAEAEAAQETVQQIDGPLDQDEQQADDRPPWADKIDWLRKNIPLADKTSLKALNADFENHMAVLPDEIVAEIDALFNARRRALSADA